jgi:hypothetical protein
MLGHFLFILLFPFFFFFILLFVIFFFLGSPYPFRLFSIAGLLDYFLGYLIVVVETAALFIYPVGLLTKRCLTLSAKKRDY